MCDLRVVADELASLALNNNCNLHDRHDSNVSESHFEYLSRAYGLAPICRRGVFPDTNAHDRKTEIAEFVVRLRNHLYSLFRYSSKLFLNLSLSLSCTVSCCRHLKEVIRFINHGVFESCLGGAPGGIGYSAALSWTISSYRRNTCLKQPISILRRVANRVYGERPAIRDLLWWSFSSHRRLFW
jgi:hypothetical protein